jgi:hypothetical protein
MLIMNIQKNKSVPIVLLLVSSTFLNFPGGLPDAYRQVTLLLRISKVSKTCT